MARPAASEFCIGLAANVAGESIVLCVKHSDRFRDRRMRRFFGGNVWNHVIGVRDQRVTIIIWLGYVILRNICHHIIGSLIVQLPIFIQHTLPPHTFNLLQTINHLE